MDDAPGIGWIGMAWDEQAAPASAVAVRTKANLFSTWLPFDRVLLSETLGSRGHESAPPSHLSPNKDPPQLA
jgi:hypothetical protein